MTYFNIRHQYGRNLYVSKGSLGSVISYYVLNDMPYHIVATKTDTLVEALLMINQLPFPRELIDIIKDYVFWDECAMIQRAIIRPSLNIEIEAVRHMYHTTHLNMVGERRTIAFEKHYKSYVSMFGYVCLQCGTINSRNGCRLCYPHEYQLQPEENDVYYDTDDDTTNWVFDEAAMAEQLAYSDDDEDQDE